jgi:hypothetical protein
MSDGFLGRWSRRKEAVREGRAVEPEPAVVPEAQRVAAAQAQAQPAPLTEPVHKPPPTLEDVESLTPEADFSRFMARDVPCDVKNAAVKRLFADPHFNVMDGLDTYIDDYSKPDPIPPAMLRQLASAHFLKLFSEEEKKEGEQEQGREVEHEPGTQTVAQSAQDAAAVPPPPNHAHDADLRLQQDHAPGPPGPGQGTE